MEAQNNRLKGLSSRRATPLTHLFYADDVVVMVEASVENGKVLLDIFNKQVLFSLGPSLEQRKIIDGESCFPGSSEKTHPLPWNSEGQRNRTWAFPGLFPKVTSKKLSISRCLPTYWVKDPRSEPTSFVGV